MSDHEDNPPDEVPEPSTLDELRTDPTMQGAEAFQVEAETPDKIYERVRRLAKVYLESPRKTRKELLRAELAKMEPDPRSQQPADEGPKPLVFCRSFVRKTRPKS